MRIGNGERIDLGPESYFLPLYSHRPFLLHPYCRGAFRALLEEIERTNRIYEIGLWLDGKTGRLAAYGQWYSLDSLSGICFVTTVVDRNYYEWKAWPGSPVPVPEAAFRV